MNQYEAETWLRIGRQMEAELIQEAEAEAQRRRIARLETELALTPKLQSQAPLKRVK